MFIMENLKQKIEAEIQTMYQVIKCCKIRIKFCKINNDYLIRAAERMRYTF